MGPLAIERIRTAVFCILGLAFLGTKANGAQLEITSDTNLPKDFKRDGEVFTPNWRYLLHLPEDYNKTRQNWPMILYLHGRSLRGDNLDRVKSYGPPAFLDRRPDFPFIVVSPQLPDEQTWPAESIHELVDEVVRKYRVDAYRIYVTGVSMGGGGAWEVAAENQKRFAAMAPLCGYGGRRIAKKVDDIPIWAFHGDQDRVVAMGPHERLIESVNDAGGEAKLTVIPGGTHGNIIFPTYDNKELYQWFLEHSRDPNIPKVEVKPITQATPVPKPIEEKESKFKFHIVSRGDTLWKISNLNGITVEALKRENGLRTDTIQIGQKLKIPVKKLIAEN